MARSSKWWLVCVLLGVAAQAAAEYPDRSIRLIVPQAAGSATDTVARILAAEMSKPLRQPVVAENRPGGTPEQFAETIKKDSAHWAEVVRRSGAKID